MKRKTETSIPANNSVTSNSKVEQARLPKGARLMKTDQLPLKARAEVVVKRYEMRCEELKQVPWSNLDVYLKKTSKPTNDSNYPPSNVLLPEAMRYVDDPSQVRFFNAKSFACMSTKHKEEQSLQAMETEEIAPSTALNSNKVVRKPVNYVTLKDLLGETKEEEEEEEETPNIALARDFGIPMENSKKTHKKVPTSLFSDLRDSVKQLRNEIGSGTRIVCKEINENKKRTYAVAWMPHFLEHSMFNATERTRTFNELVDSESMCRLHLDFDMRLDYRKENSTITTTTKTASESAVEKLNAWLKFKTTMDAAVERFVQNLIVGMHEKFGILNKSKTTKVSWLTLDSSDPKKFSQHVVVSLNEDGFLFKNRRSVGNYVSETVENEAFKIRESDPSKNFINARRNMTSDPFLDFINEEKRKEREADDGEDENSNTDVVDKANKDKKDRLVLKKRSDINNDSTWNYAVALSRDRTYGLVLKSVDSGIYRGEKEFRMLGSTKYGQNRPFHLQKRTSCNLVYNVESGKCDLVDVLATKHLFYNRSLVTSNELPRIERHVKGIKYEKRNSSRGKEQDQQELEEVVDFGEDEDEEIKEENKTSPIKTDTAAKGEEIGFLDFRQVFYESLIVPFFHKSLYKRLESITSLEYVDRNEESMLKANNLLELRKSIIAKMLGAEKSIAENKNESALKSANSTSLRSFSSVGGVDATIDRFFRKKAFGYGDIGDDGGDNFIKNVLSQMTMSDKEVDARMKEILEWGDEEDDYELDSEEGKENLASLAEHMLGIKIISEIATNVELKAGLLAYGDRLVFRKEFFIGDDDEMHYLMFSTKGFKVCQLKAQRCGPQNAEHRNNTVYFVVRLNDNKFYQKCHDDDCCEYYVRNVSGVDIDSASDEDLEEIRKSARGPMLSLSQSLWSKTQRLRENHKKLVRWNEMHF